MWEEGGTDSGFASSDAEPSGLIIIKLSHFPESSARFFPSSASQNIERALYSLTLHLLGIALEATTENVWGVSLSTYLDEKKVRIACAQIHYLV